MGAIDRRRLYYQNDLDHDSSLCFDVNEYLIEAWPELSLKARKSVWTTCQNDSEFSFSDIEYQIDQAVLELCKNNPDLNIVCETHEFAYDDEDEVQDDSSFISFDVKAYLDEYWPTLTEDQSEFFTAQLVNGDVLDLTEFTQAIDNVIFEATETDTSIILPECEDEEDQSVNSEA